MENPFEIILKRIVAIEEKLDKLAKTETNSVPEPQQGLITGTELRKLLNISRPTETKYRRTGKLPFVWAGGQYRYDLEKVMQTLSSKIQK